MDKTSKSSSPSGGWLKHRFTRMLLRSSCSITTAAAATGLVNKHSSISLQRQEPVSYPHCRSDDDRPKLRQHLLFPSSNDRIALVEPLLPWTRKEEKKTKKERRATKIGDLYETGEVEGRKCHYISHHEDKKKKKACGRRGKRGMETRNLLSNNAYGFSSSSSSDCNDELGLFSCGEEEEDSGTLFSSKRFSSDSSDFYCNNNRRKKKKSRSKSMKPTRRPPRRGNDPSRDPWIRNNKLWPLASTNSAEKKTKAEMEAGFAVVKNSSDPYMDFRSSMVEMIVERQISSASGMDKLLNSYLCLNSPLHHPVILEAFVDIWEAILG